MTSISLRSSFAEEDLVPLGKIYAQSFQFIVPTLFPAGLDAQHLAWRTSILANWSGKAVRATAADEKDDQAGKARTGTRVRVVKASRYSDAGEEELLGFALYKIHHTPPQPSDDEDPPGVPKSLSEPENIDRPLWKDFKRALDENKERYMGRRSFGLIQLLAVTPEARGHGIGAMLTSYAVSDIRSHSDESGSALPVYLEATSPARPLYERLGFRFMGPIEDISREEGQRRFKMHAMILDT